jgi:hypothetical protein
MFEDEWMSDVQFGITFQAPHRATSGIDRELLRAPAQKSNAAPVPDSYKQVKIQGERFVPRYLAAATPAFVAKFNQVLCAADDLTKLMTIK